MCLNIFFSRPWRRNIVASMNTCRIVLSHTSKSFADNCLQSICEHCVYFVFLLFSPMNRIIEILFWHFSSLFFGSIWMACSILFSFYFRTNCLGNGFDVDADITEIRYKLLNTYKYCQRCLCAHEIVNYDFVVFHFILFSK